MKTRKQTSESPGTPLASPLTVPEFAKLIGFHHVSVQRILREGRIEGAVKLGRRWAIPQPVADRILREGIPLEAVA